MPADTRQSIAAQLGINIISGFSSTLSLPRITGSDEGEWLAEGQSASAGSHETTFGQVVTEARRIYSEVAYTRQFFAQTAAAEADLRKLVTGKRAASCDRAVLVGAGGVQPIGILQDANTTTVSSGSDGAAPTVTILNNVEHEPINNKVPLKAGACGWVVSPAARRKMKTTAKIASGSECLVQSVPEGDRVNGFRGFATAFLPDDLTKGSGSSLGSAIFGADWSTITIVIYGAIDLLVDRYSLATSGQLSISTNVHADVAKRRPEAFAKLKDIVTT